MINLKFQVANQCTFMSCAWKHIFLLLNIVLTKKINYLSLEMLFDLQRFPSCKMMQTRHEDVCGADDATLLHLRRGMRKHREACYLQAVGRVITVVVLVPIS